MKLPELFEEKMRRLLGEDFEEYEKHLDDPAVYVIEAAHDGKKEKSYWTVLPGAEALITMLRENMEALGEKYEEDVDNAKNSKEACGEDEKVQFMWENKS